MAKVFGIVAGGPIGIVIGAFVGTVLGTAFGNLFGSEDEPQAWAHIVYDKDEQEYRTGANYGSDGGDPLVAQSMAQKVIQGINEIIETSHGKLRSGAAAPKVQIGFEGNEFQVAIGGGSVKSFGTTADAIHYAAFKIMKDFDLVGGHMVVMRAWHNSDATNIYEWLEDIQVAEAFQNYLANPTAILALMMNDPDSELAQSWAAILQRAAELELHLHHEKDLDGGWGEILLAQGVSSEFIPDITGDTLTLTDPVTGEERVLHHIIGPGYEIVRIEGTDGNDIIEVIVDGPSISYVNGGAGDDVIEGSDQVDVIVGGSGDDTINGYEENDWLHGGAGNDTLDGGAGDDLVVGGEDNDYLIGDSENDHIYGNGGQDYLFGGEGQDFLFGGTGNDVLDAGEGIGDEVYGGAGDDTLYGGDYHWLTGGKGNDTFILEDGDQTSYIKISRGDGHDIIQGQSDHMNFVRLDPTISVNELFLKKEADDLIIYILGEDQSITVKDYYAGFSVQPNIGLQAYYNNVRAHTVLDNLGDSDTATANITVTALPIINGTFGNNTINGTSASEFIYGHEGKDYLYAKEGDDFIYGGAGADKITGDEGDDYIEDNSTDGFVTGTVSGHNNWFLGGEGNDHMVGGEGRDVYFDGYGNATYNHMDDYGTTNDWYSYWISGDLVRVTDRGGFSDNQAIYGKILKFSNVVYERYMDTDLSITNTDGRINIIHTDTFTDLNNVTGVGVEEIYISGGWRNLKSTILNYSDVMITRGSGGDDVINGINIANRDDEIYAGAGDDTLYGDDGIDILYGESGADIFGFRVASAYQDVDVIKDFDVVEGDAINIVDLLSAYDPLSDVISDFVQITDNGVDSTLAIDADGGGDNYNAITTLENVTGLDNVTDLELTGVLITSNSM